MAPLQSGRMVRGKIAYQAGAFLRHSLVHLLLERCDHVVRRDDLRAAAWPSSTVTDRAVDGRISRLRRRVGSVGLQITTIRGSGYLLERMRLATAARPAS